MKRPLLFASILLVSASVAEAACDLNVRVVTTPVLALAWDHIPGVTSYQIQESLDGLVTSRNYFVAGQERFAIARRASGPVKVSYVVTARIAGNVSSVGPSLDACTEALMTTLPADAELRRITRKGILPIVGSTTGAFGGQFKTSLRLTATTGQQSGRIVFHPAGSIGSDSDPSVHYGFSGVGDSVFYDDIVSQLGRTGIGTIDIVPDEDASQTLPEVEARLFNDTSIGTFGGYESVAFPFDYLSTPSMTVQIPAGAFRVNVGLRTLTATSLRVLIYGTDKRLRAFHEATFPADYMTMGNVEQMLGQNLVAGESFTMIFTGSVIPFHTITENRTNDPAVFVARRTASSDVGNYIE